MERFVQLVCEIRQNLHQNDQLDIFEWLNTTPELTVTLTMTLFPWNAMNYDDPSGSSACWLDPFHILMSSKFPTTYTTMRCDLCLVIGCLLQKRLAHLLPSNFAFFTFFSLLNTLNFISWSVNLACRWTLYEETLAGWQEIPKNASWFTAPASGIFWVLKFLLGNMLGSCGMLCYNLHCLICSKKNCNEPIWHQCYPAVFVCLCRLFLTVNKCSPVWRKNVRARVGFHPETLPPLKIW